MENLDWLPMDPSMLDQSLLDQSIPIIDLTNPNADNRAALQMLLSMAGESLNPNKTADVRSFSQIGRLALMDLKEQTPPDPDKGVNPKQEQAQGGERAAKVVQEVLPDLGTGKSQGVDLADKASAELEKVQAGPITEETAPDSNQGFAEDKDKPAGRHPDLSSRLAPEPDQVRRAGNGESRAEVVENGKQADDGLHSAASRDTFSFHRKSTESKSEKLSSGTVQETAVSPDPTPGDKDTGHKITLHSEVDHSQLQEDAPSLRDNLPAAEKGGEGSEIRVASNAHDRTPAAAASQARKEPVQLPRDMQTDVIRQIVDRMSLRSDRGQTEMKIRLKPEFLGDLRLHVATENHHVMVRITADSPAVKEMIEHNLPMLKTELQQHGLQIDKFDVFVGQDQETWKHRQQQNASHDARRGKQRYAGRKEFDPLEEIEADQVPGTWRRRPESAMKEVDFFA
ncbi:MAG: flagellar hook-length control protein FliK [Desulfosarcinaceae bacterium]